MSIFTGITKAEHTVAAWMEKELAVIIGKAPEVAKVADAVLKYAGPALQIIVTAELGAGAGAECGLIVGEIQRDLAVTSALIFDFGSNPSAIQLLNGIVSNLGALLAAGHIKSAGNVANATKVVNSLDSLAQALAPKTA